VEQGLRARVLPWHEVLVAAVDGGHLREAAWEEAVEAAQLAAIRSTAGWLGLDDLGRQFSSNQAGDCLAYNGLLKRGGSNGRQGAEDKQCCRFWYHCWFCFCVVVRWQPRGCVDSLGVWLMESWNV
jgi:hypothetical protein